MNAHALIALASLLAASVLAPEKADPNARVAGDEYLIVNSSDAALLCVVRIGRGEWSEPFTLAPAQQVRPAAGKGGDPDARKGELLCNPPVVRVRYTLRPGGRYTLLRDPAGDGAGGEGPVRLYGLAK